MEATQHNYSPIMADSRKRTRRQRPSSSLTLSMASSTTTTTSANEDGHTQKPINTYHMPTTTSIEFTKINQENEEEDMANCLILLAHSQSSSPPSLHKTVTVARTSKFYVYKCKTCNRGFSSFQALGGHRASHKKPSNPNLEDKSRPSITKLQDVDIHRSSTTTLSLGSNQMTHCNPSGSIKIIKIHICSICGADFGSGQALGGHMRRHRTMPLATTNCCGSGGCQESKKSKKDLSLDLNLPAPIEDDQIPFRSRDQMIAFSNSSLVHCHF